MYIQMSIPRWSHRMPGLWTSQERYMKDVNDMKIWLGGIGWKMQEGTASNKEKGSSDRAAPGSDCINVPKHRNLRPLLHNQACYSIKVLNRTYRIQSLVDKVYVSWQSNRWTYLCGRKVRSCRSQSCGISSIWCPKVNQEMIGRVVGFVDAG